MASKYKSSNIIRDLIAGFTVGLTVIPQGLAYASIAKLPLVYGLYSSFMGCFIYLFLGMSKDITVGPTAIMSLLVSEYGKPMEGYEDIHDPRYAVLLSFFCGLFQILMGITHMGFVTNFISLVVVSGFTSASAITIGMGQVKNLLGIKFSSEGFFHDLIELIKHIKQARWQDLLLGLSSLFCLAILRWCKNRSQTKLDKLGKRAPLKRTFPWKFIWIVGTARNAVVVIVTSFIAFLIIEGGNEDVFSVTGNVTSGLPPIQPPDFQTEDIFKYLNSGIIIIPLIGFLENIAIARGFARQNNYKVESNQELIALGSCNFAASFVSAYPSTGSFSRSAINSQSDVATQAGGIVTGILVLLSLAFLTPLFYYIPKPTLAAVIIYAVIFMVDYEIVPELWRSRKPDLLTLGATFFLSLWLGVEYGTLIGIGVDLLMLLYPYAKFKTTIQKRKVAVIKFERGIRFPALDKMQSLLDQECFVDDIVIPAIFDCTYASSIDYSVIETFKDSVKSFRKKGSHIAVTNCRPKILRTFERANIEGLLIYETVEDAKIGIQALQGENREDMLPLTGTKHDHIMIDEDNNDTNSTDPQSAL